MYKLYDRVKLKDGRTGFICEIFENESDMLLDVELGNSKYDTICITKDDIEYGTDRRIPIWLLGFLY